MCLLTQSLSFCFSLCTSILLTTSVYTMSSSAARRRAWALPVRGVRQIPCCSGTQTGDSLLCFSLPGSQSSPSGCKKHSFKVKKKNKSKVCRREQDCVHVQGVCWSYKMAAELLVMRNSLVR